MKKIVKKILSSMVIMVLLMSVCQVNAFAVTPMGNGFSEVVTVSSMQSVTGGNFVVPSGNNRLTVTAKAIIQAGSSGSATITLQKWNGIYWSNVSSATIATNGSASQIFSGLSVSSGSTYHFVYSTNVLAVQVVIGGAYGYW